MSFMSSNEFTTLLQFLKDLCRSFDFNRDLEEKGRRRNITSQLDMSGELIFKGVGEQWSNGHELMVH